MECSLFVSRRGLLNGRGGLKKFGIPVRRWGDKISFLLCRGGSKKFWCHILVTTDVRVSNIT